MSWLVYDLVKSLKDKSFRRGEVGWGPNLSARGVVKACEWMSCWIVLLLNLVNEWDDPNECYFVTMNHSLRLVVVDGT